MGGLGGGRGGGGGEEGGVARELPICPRLSNILLGRRLEIELSVN